MQSLRTRKPTQSTPKSSAQRQPARLARAPAGGAGSRNAKKSRVDDKIKKRMSMRYANISHPTGASGVPDVPSLPALPLDGKGRPPAAAVSSWEDEALQDRSVVAEDPKARDRKILDQEDFNPDACES